MPLFWIYWFSFLSWPVHSAGTVRGIFDPTTSNLTLSRPTGSVSFRRTPKKMPVASCGSDRPVLHVAGGCCVRALVDSHPQSGRHSARELAAVSCRAAGVCIFVRLEGSSALQITDIDAESFPVAFARTGYLPVVLVLVVSMITFVIALFLRKLSATRPLQRKFQLTEPPDFIPAASGVASRRADAHAGGTPTARRPGLR